jgi:hypothetical protein
MNLDQQLQLLLDQAPPDGQIKWAVGAIAPILKQLASNLKHLEYYIAQNMNQQWAVTTLQSTSDSTTEKRVIYAFSKVDDLANAPFLSQNPELVALPVPVTHILFQMSALKIVDSTVFFENPGDYSTGVEISCRDVQNLIRQELSKSQPSRNIPPDIA